MYENLGISGCFLKLDDSHSSPKIDLQQPFTGYISK